MKAAIRHRSGFTLVELLIVIVVIAILAAISTVSYAGMQQRADEARIAASLNSYLKVFESIKAVDGGYPDTEYGCLGAESDYPATEVFEQGACTMRNGEVDSEVDSELNTAFAKHLSSLPSAKLAPVRVDYGGSMTYDYRGVWVESDTHWFQIQYWLKGNRTCPIGNKSYHSTPDATSCILVKF